MQGSTYRSVSIVIPAHNAERSVRRAIESAVTQTMKPAEVIVIDDHSTDATAPIAASFPAPIRLISASARGSNPARNLGLELATSDWVQFLDADDFLLPNKLERQLSAISADAAGVDLVYSPSLILPAPDLASAANSARADDDPIESFLSNRGFQTGAVLWRRTALLAIGGWKADVPRCQDYEVVFRAFRAGLRMRWCPYAGAAYCVADQRSLSRSQPLATLQCNLQLVRDFCGWLEARNLFRGHYATLGQIRLLDLLWSAALLDADWAQEHYAKLISAGYIQPRWNGSRVEKSLRLLGWKTSVRLRRAFGRKPTPS
ncbi:MAG: hypothetical protein RIQ93_1268 [Verrucomicrobiota bacterium]|jgi:glycosyltransferase involved in cell wall biosynthesis